LTSIERRGPDGGYVHNGVDKGFTLVELLIIIFILGILAAIVVFSITNTNADSEAVACRTDYKTVEAAQEAFKSQTGTYANSINTFLGTAVGVDGSHVGPWLKDMPANTTHYSITIDTTPGPTFGTVQVASANPDHAPQDGDANCAYA
jgi:prepilin-type N-terminal cleavage/methylation domain-containing protein